MDFTNIRGCHALHFMAGAEQEHPYQKEFDYLHAIIKDKDAEINCLREQNRMLYNVINELKEQVKKQAKE